MRHPKTFSLTTSFEPQVQIQNNFIEKLLKILLLELEIDLYFNIISK